MKKWHAALTALPLLIALSAGCSGGDDGNNGNNDAGMMNDCLEPTFTSIHGLFSSETCAGEGCHDAETMGGGQDYTLGKAAVYSTMLMATVNDIGAQDYPNRVVPNEPDMSFLWIKLTRDDAPLGRMPLAMAPLAQCDLDAIRTWIENGAAND